MTETNWLIVGLGNPGDRYERTRHNFGFMLIDHLARDSQTQVRRNECRGLIGRAEIENEVVELAKPQTFMNLSGETVSCLLRKDNRSRDKLIIVIDDLAIPFGTIRIRPKGADGGHNGLKSITACLGTQDYIRLRIGIKPDHPVSDTSRFVLEKFSKLESESTEEILIQSAKAISTVLFDGIDKAMAVYN